MPIRGEFWMLIDNGQEIGDVGRRQRYAVDDRRGRNLWVASETELRVFRSIKPEPAQFRNDRHLGEQTPHSYIDRRQPDICLEQAIEPTFIRPRFRGLGD